ncbi:MAG TPA: TetR/AcrR family transcriptional regulator [Candidatus Limiplasma sp.]|nr:TetR/AcrR family transcriptional regulator [Candidatus Limiplasma sp.]HRX07902.1 TetR/AcrR family transcriptional regulator [Candidatus Limiplasma sp.]
MIDKKAEIYRHGKALFEEKGYKNTNVAEIMKAAGFATGSFYRYYPSKDHLFMEIYNQENVMLKKTIIDSVDIHADPMAVMQEMMSKNLAGMQANPILREWYDRDTFYKIERSFRQTHAIEHVDFFVEGFTDVIKIWQKEGRMRSDIKPAMIIAIFAAFVNIDLHKEEIGLQFFPELMDHIGAFIMCGLTGKTGV